MVEIIPGSNGKAVRIGIERKLLQFWIVANVHSTSNGQLILIRPQEFSHGPFDREYHGESWNGGPRSMTVETAGNLTTLRQFAPSGRTLGSIAVESKRLRRAIAKFAPGFPSKTTDSIPEHDDSQVHRTETPTVIESQNQATSQQCVQLSPEWFWQAFRRELYPGCTDEALSSSRAWTKVVIAAAERTCEQLGNEVVVRREYPNRLDVSARFSSDSELAIAFESELAPVGYMGRTHAKTWREEFVKLCRIPARLRVLSSYFMPGTGRAFESFLRRQLDELAEHFRTATPGQWLLTFGSEDSTRDPDQPWLCFSLDPDLSLRRVDNTEKPFCPRRIARGLDASSA